MLEQAEALRPQVRMPNSSSASMNTLIFLAPITHAKTATGTGAQSTISAPAVPWRTGAVAQFGSAPRSHRGVRVQIPQPIHDKSTVHILLGG